MDTSLTSDTIKINDSFVELFNLIFILIIFYFFTFVEKITFIVHKQ